MSSQQVSQTPSPTQPTAPVKAVRAKKEKVVKEKKEKKEKVVAAKAEKVVAAKAEKVVAAKAEKEVKEEVVEVKEKKARVPTLPAKFNKFIQFSYYLIRTLNNAELEKSGEVLFDEERFFEEANVFAAVDVQQRFVEGFLENKAIGKEMRTHVLDKKKAEKAAAKQKIADDKAVAKKKVIDDKAAAKKEKAAAKKPATKKKPKKEEPVDLVTSLVTLANSSGDDVKTVKDEIEEEEEEDELDVKVIEIDGKSYLIDESTSNLYDNDTHAMVGAWNSVTKEITRV
jgi:hypothetical protein